ncbi:MAG: hypothetical protein JNM25_14730 [Planctomycetes bacterium]|nr:hypothetical protein [Planctomycetota bacterium]
MCALTFAEPQRLWWLLLLPLLLWLALPPQPRRHAFTAHLAQWQAAHAALRRRPPRLAGLRFLLLALAATAAIGAHAAPQWRSGDGPRRLVVLLDASASMGARRADGTSAFAAASALLRERLAALPPQVDVTVLRCGGPRLRRQGASARMLQDLGRPEGALDVDLPALAAAVAAPDTAVWTLTDGQAQAALPVVGALSCLPATGPNAALLAVRVVDRWPLPQLSLSADLVLFAAAPRTGELRVAGAVAAAVPTRVELTPGVPLTIDVELARTAAGGVLELSLAVTGDVLPDDDVWRADLPALPAPRIAVLTDAEAGPFAAVAAQALAVEVGGTVTAASPGAEVGLLLVDGGTAAIVPGQVRALCFGCRLDAAVEVVPWLQPRVADWDRQSPLTAGLDLSELRLAAAFRGVLPPGEAFLWADDDGGVRTPLAVVVDGGDTASVHFAFRLQDGNLPLLAAFPQLLRRAFVRCHGTAAAITVMTPTTATGEQDLQSAASAEDRPLPGFPTPDRELAAPCLLLGLLALALRAFVR